MSEITDAAGSIKRKMAGQTTRISTLCGSGSSCAADAEALTETEQIRGLFVSLYGRDEDAFSRASNLLISFHVATTHNLDTMNQNLWIAITSSKLKWLIPLVRSKHRNPTLVHRRTARRLDF